MLYNNISCLSYRIYVDKQGWKLLAISKKPEDTIKIVEEAFKQEYKTLVVAHDFDIDADVDAYSINSEENLLYFKQKLLGLPQNVAENSKKLVKTSKKQQNIDKN